jgi:hypothetical protein
MPDQETGAWLDSFEDEENMEYLDDDERLLDDCGRHPGSTFQCDDAGTEYCDFRCPFSRD